MNRDVIIRLVNLGVSLLIAWLVWSYYRCRTFPPALRYSTFGPRFWTGSVDSCILWPIGFITTALLSLNLPRILAAFLLIVESLAWLFYTVVMHARYGQTVGKMVTKVRVVDFRTEGKISYLQAWLRESIPMVLSLGFLGYQIFTILTGTATASDIENGKALAASKPFWLLAALPGLWFLAEVLTMFTNEKRRALHDFIASTVVVRTNIQETGIQQGTSPDAGLAVVPPAA